MSPVESTAISEGQGWLCTVLGRVDPGVSLHVARTYTAAKALISPYRERTVNPTEKSEVSLTVDSSLEKEDHFSDFCGTFNKKITALKYLLSCVSLEN